MRYDIFLWYLMDELECASETEPRLCSEALIECLVRHRQLISGRGVWSPKARAYVQFEQRSHGSFAVLRPGGGGGGPTVVQFLGKLLPLYCRLCFLCECHDRARGVGQALLARLTESRDLTNHVLEFEIRALAYLTDNLVSSPPSEVGETCQSSDVSAGIKIAVELLWSHLVLVYAGNRKLLLCNLERFFTRPQDSLNLCPRELRAALFVHGKHDPSSQRKERCGRKQVALGTKCPVLPLVSDPRCTPRAKLTAANRLYESRVARLCWLGALWILDVDCNKGTLHWLYKAEPHRA